MPKRLVLVASSHFFGLFGTRHLNGGRSTTPIFSTQNRSLDLFQFPFDNKKPLLDVLCPCPPEGLSASRLARPKRTLARLIVKSFLGINAH